MEGDPFHYWYLLITYGLYLMLKSTVPSEEDYKNFLRPAVYDSLRQVLKFYGLETASQIYYNGENEIAKLVGSNATDRMGTDEYTDGVFRNKIFIVPEFNDSPFNTGYSNQRREPTERAVWMNDDKIPMALFPGFTGNKIDVTVVGAFNSERVAKDWVKRINRLQSQQMVDMNFSATVHLGVNPSVLELFSHVYDLLKKNDPTQPEFGDWFSKYCKAPFTTISNVAGNHKRLVVPMRLDNIGISFTEATVAQAKKATQYGKYQVEFRYSFYFQYFTHWEIEYPLNVYQDEIDQAWIPRVQDKFKEPFNIRVNPETAFVKAFSNNRKKQMPYFLKLPDHDPWVMPREEWVQPLIQARLQVADVDDQELLNIFDIPGFKWNPKVKEYMLRRREWVFSQFNTPFLVWIYSDGVRVLPSQLRMDENGGVWLNRKPNMKNTYRCVVTLDYAIRDYTQEFWTDLENNEDDHVLLPAIFNWYKWDLLPKPWTNYVPQIRRDINLGRGLPANQFNNYMMDLGLNAYLLLEDVRYAPRY